MDNCDEKRAFRVLTLDGGGMRGLYTASKLQALARLFDERFVKQSPDIGQGFDLICGTSTGAVLACALAAGVSLNEVCELYCKQGSSIFPNPIPSHRLKLFWWSARYAFRPAACSQRLQEGLEKLFGDRTLADVYTSRKIAICIPTVDALSQKAWVFKTPHFPLKHRDNNYRLVDVCMASAAAPILFPLSKLLNPDNKHDIHYFVDGGLWANNPVMIGLVEAFALASSTQKIEIISVGTCDRPSGDPYTVKNPKWGLFKWKVGVNAIDMSLSAQSFGYAKMAGFLAQALSAYGRHVTVVRLDQSQKSPEQLSAVGLDRADQVAIDTLINMAGKDAEQIHSQAMVAESHEMSVVSAIFRNLNPFVGSCAKRE